MVAIYVGPPRNKKLWEDGRLSNRIGDCAHIVAEMFRTVGEIQVRERLELERRALSDIVGLVPTFADEDMSPSDAVAELLPKFDTIFEGHGHVGNDCYQHRPDGKSHEWVTFLSITYREPDKMRKPSTPVLSVYPQIKARENYLQSYRVSRRDTLSISKYLLYSYLKSKDIPTPVEFKQQFDKVQKVPEKAFYRDNGVPLGLILTKRDKAWDDLQFDIFGKYTRTTAAFLLRRFTEDESEDKKKPFAILVFESDHPDAFSHDDIELLYRLVNATAYLHSEIKIGSHSLDYSALCKEAFTDIVPGDVGEVPYWKIAFELSRFDHRAAQQILNCDDDIAKKLWKDNDKLATKAVRNGVLDIIQKIDRLKSPEDKFAFDRWLWNNTDTRDLLNEKWGENAIDIHHFLTAVPPNDVWYCYLGSIGRALASRGFKPPDKVPEFKRFPTGYNALAMFVVDQEFEERQIAKLTEYRKLKKEQENYKKYVRYKIPLAARIAEKGIAFDTLGRGKEHTEEDGFGVIISDLIAGTSKEEEAKGTPLSFLSRCHDVIDLGPGKQTVKIVEEIVEAIRYHFEDNINVWKIEGDTDWKDKPPMERRRGEVPGYIEDWTRTGATERSENIDQRLNGITNRIAKRKNLTSATLDMLRATELYFQRVVDGYSLLFDSSASLRHLVKRLTNLRPFTGPFESMVEQNHFKASYVHGDLNGNNLTWAAHYKQFVMIDFESVKLGVVGFDQLKLFASMICETISTTRRRLGRKKNSVTDAQHHAMIGLVRLVPWLISNVIQVRDKNDRKNNLKNHLKIVSDRKEYLSEIAIEIIRTADFDGLQLKSEEEQQFWIWIVRNMFFRQFEYAYRNLDESHVGALRDVASAIEGMDTVKLDEITEVPNIMKDIHENNVIMLFYSFLALLATLERKE